MLYKSTVYLLTTKVT